MLLEMHDAVLNYGKIQALHGISVEVADGEVVSLIGANGAGKTSTMRALSGVRGLAAGRIVFDGEDVTKLRADQRMRKGLVLAPEGRGIFPGMTVVENLNMGAYTRRDKEAIEQDYERVYTLFPRMSERRKQVAGRSPG
jgi:branched-chain amino acid transport system ATP-binding protein